MLPLVRLVDIRETPLSVDEVFQAVQDPAAGGTALFVGTVRDVDPTVDPEAKVVRLDYSSHPSALDKLRDVAERVATEPGVIAVAAVHRVGELAVGDLAVVVAAAAGHRTEAFVACRRLIDELKAEVPLWKHEVFVDGETAWVHGA
ncbi:MAG TPA: molybdenum cofactor biosynthesis protein MoaE [Aeromicrobium sp.]|nr:molybdenum cofactor biosynthesis protein MoaE [Aeromicrobium sp.]